MRRSVVLAGCGNMGHAMLTGWLKSRRLSAEDVVVVEPNEELRRRADALGVVTSAGAPGFLRTPPGLVVLAVKPQIISEAAAAYRQFGSGDTVFLSIAAGVSINTLERLLGEETPIIRCMPNTPAAIGEGMLAVHPNAHVTADALAFVEQLLSTSGALAVIDDESQMDAVTAVSGSGPAYVFHFIECLAQAAEDAGLPADAALLLARQTVYGAARLAVEGNESPGVLRQQVTSPNGTTAAALSVLMGEDRLKKLVSEAVEAARLRSIELGKGA